MPEALNTCPSLSERLDLDLGQFPPDAGVYLMKDGSGAVLYVGKAKNLRKRIGSYCKSPDQLDPKTAVLLKKIESIETVVAGSEKEALILESNLIKRYRPRYNVVLKDDKRYPSLRLNLNHPYPNLTIVRKTAKDGALYFGPFASAQAVRQTLKFIDKTFKLRKCKDGEFQRRTRPCLHRQMGNCWGPCSSDVDPERYRETVREVVLFLNGRTPELIRQIKRQMREAAKEQAYEAAAALRDKVFSLEKTLERQVAVTVDFGDRDAVGLACGRERCVITLLRIRGGYLLGARDFELPRSPASDAEMVESFIRQYYGQAPSAPGEVLVPEAPEEVSVLEDWLRGEVGRRVRVRRPQRGEKAKVLQLAQRNAKKRLEEMESAAAAKQDLLDRLGRRLGAPKRPVRIECFDNSNFAGKSAVSAMIVFLNGEPAKSHYRKYRLHTTDGSDDYAAMKEVISRRYREGAESESLPDLLLIDGGKGQLGIVTAVLEELGIRDLFHVAAIAKGDEKKGEDRDKIYLPGRSNPVVFGREDDLILFLQRVRDEAHRFAVGYHRKRRTAEALSSRLDSIPGIGPRRKRALIRRFGSTENMARASLEELKALPEMTQRVAEAVKKALS